MNRGKVEEGKKGVKSLHTIQIAVGDKENLSSKSLIAKKKPAMNSTKLTNIKKIKKTVPIDNKTTVDLKNKININKTKTQKTDNSNIPVVTAQDLTGDAPSENYWQQLAESRRVALESTMKENVDLHNKINELEYENTRLKEMVDEAKNLVEILTEMLEDKEGEEHAETADEGENTVLDETKDNDSTFDSLNDSHDNDQDDISFQSCL